jgi:hypothetical protein
MNNIYDAIMKAADHIERNPELFQFHRIYVPECGTPACALGWIGFFVGSKDATRIATDGLTNVGYVAETALKIHDAGVFYAFMQENAGLRWQRNAAECAAGMRLFAKRYRDASPDWKTIAGSPLIPDHVRSEDAAHV